MGAQPQAKPVTPMHCNACGTTSVPTMALLKSGQIGPQCVKCGVEFGIAVTGSVAGGIAEDGNRVPLQRVVPTKREADQGARVVPMQRPRPTRASPELARRVLDLDEVALPEEQASETLSPTEIVAARLAEAEAELARLKIEQCRMRGLETEVRALRREHARLTGNERREGTPP
ncbi:MAG TPA: hypothetical protein VGI39_39095 [Polyangiaceae bacterium]|jgi:hypothetical protein